MPQLRVFLTERGFSFGDNNPVVDMLALVVFEGRHSVKTPSSATIWPMPTRMGQMHFL
jgi:3-deoxy-D-manno-octulosonic acid (KDO) 8-phosphate synthase